jgi:hypothetical protein
LNLYAYFIAKQLAFLVETWREFLSSSKSIKKKLDRAESYEEYMMAALEMDQSLKLDSWRASCTAKDQELFDASLISKIKDRLVRYRNEKKIDKLLWVLRDACKNDLGIFPQ